jgi:accessory gene regulator B
VGIRRENMEQITNKILGKLKKYDEKNKIIENEDIYRYGGELIISSVVGFAIVLMEGAIMKMPLESIIFFISFATLRMYIGGYHAKNYLRCNTLFVVCCGCCFYLYKISVSYITDLMSLIVCLGNAILIMKYAPIVHIKKPLDEERKNKCKRRGMVVLEIQFVVLYIACKLNYMPGKMIIYAILLVDVLVIIVKGGICYEEKHCRKNFESIGKSS